MNGEVLEEFLAVTCFIAIEHFGHEPMHRQKGRVTTALFLIFSLLLFHSLVSKIIKQLPAAFGLNPQSGYMLDRQLTAQSNKADNSSGNSSTVAREKAEIHKLI